mgnify:CR=1 FL=1
MLIYFVLVRIYIYFFSSELSVTGVEAQIIIKYLQLLKKVFEDKFC